MPQLTLETPLFEVVGARSPSLRHLEKMGIKTVGDLLWHFPARYEDFTKVYTVADLEPGQQATVRGTIEDIRTRHSFRRHMSIVEATIADASGSIRAVWFNQPYVATTLKPGREANFAGKASVSDEGELYLNNPTYEVVRVRPGMNAVGPDGEVVEQEFNHTGRLVPIYPETQGLTSRGIRFVIQQLFRHEPAFKEWIPAEILEEFHFAELEEAIHEIHFPRTIEEAQQARARFSFEDLFLLQLITLREKMKLAAVHAPAMTVDIEWVKELLARLPFELTVSQKKSLWEIIQDMERAHPMNRLLQGDVGSGKTIVAAIAALIAARNGFQTAFMAPTEILARQHFETMKKLFAHFAEGKRREEGKKDIGKKEEGLGGAIPALGLLTSANAIIDYGDGLVESRATKAAFNAKSAAGEVAIIFGTHALIQKSAAFKNLGLGVIDEQHRFGVSQRAELLTKTKTTGNGGGTTGAVAQALSPHFLSMSATPIPRTLMLSIFGDLDLSLITELPSGRKIIQTKIVPPPDRAAAYDFIRSQVKEGRQVFVICPRIDPAEEEDEGRRKEEAREEGKIKSPARVRALQTALELKSVKEEFEKLSTKIFPDLHIAMLHGQMKAKEKEETMKKFKDRDYDIVVSTSVVEVGVDVPNATIMMIEGAERFGLAQLYQFRGRVGRGEHQSYCFLMADSAAKAANARLKAILEAKNGFELAEKDLALRGPGQFFGQVQTGLPDVAMEALRDPELVKHSREAAIKLLQDDPQFKKNPPLRKKFEEFRAKLHRE